MNNKDKAFKKQKIRMAVLAIIGGLLLSYPLLSLYSGDDSTLFGIPKTFTVIYSIWFILIGISFVITHHFDRHDS